MKNDLRVQRNEEWAPLNELAVILANGLIRYFSKQKLGLVGTPLS